MIFRVILAVVLVSTTVEAADGDVKFWMDKVTLTCPQVGTWYQGSGKKVDNDDVTRETYTYDYKDKGLYYCKYTAPNSDDETTYYFYIEGKACLKCLELDGLVFAVVIVSDVIGTVVVMAIVFKCTKKKAARPQHTTRAARPKADTSHDSQYEALNLNTRSSEYSTVINRTG